MEKSYEQQYNVDNQPPPYQSNTHQTTVSIASYPKQDPISTPLQPPPNYGGQPGPSNSYPQNHPPNPNNVTFVTQTTTAQKSTMAQFQRFIPAMPMCLAVTCLVINCILPGFGSIIASFSVFCCDRSTSRDDRSAFSLFCITFWIGWAQLITCPFGVGWAWSIWWGYGFVFLAGQASMQENVNVVTTTTTTTVPLEVAPLPPPPPGFQAPAPAPAPYSIDSSYPQAGYSNNLPEVKEN
ncbi:uncharacterized protein LOC143465727 [Clavelina lepadiformis]|uniref:uncharacterized protein LOC143465727 n=1 Tax=Clavelina lepadiformis TaxID=159417 RepID=UPI004041B746